MTKMQNEINEHFESKGETPFNNACYYKHKKGHWVKILCKGEVIEWSEEGAPLRMQGVHTIVEDNISNTEMNKLIKKVK
jgi:hypothetical protein